MELTPLIKTKIELCLAKFDIEAVLDTIYAIGAYDIEPDEVSLERDAIKLLVTCWEEMQPGQQKGVITSGGLEAEWNQYADGAECVLRFVVAEATTESNLLLDSRE